MKIKMFEDFSEELKIGDKVKIKENLSNLLNSHPLYKRNDNRGIDKFFGKNATITYIAEDNGVKFGVDPFNRYNINIDNGDYWWIDECFE